jgi:hypothetical protein
LKNEQTKNFYAADYLKGMLFKVFYVDGNSHWAKKLNSAILNCHEKLGGNRDNYQDISINSFVNLFVCVTENVEKSCNFNNEIQQKKEQQKLKIIRDIQEKLQ